MTLLHSIPREGPVRPALSPNEKLAVMWLNLSGTECKINISPERKIRTIQYRDGWTRRWKVRSTRQLANDLKLAKDYHLKIINFRWTMIGIK